MDDANILLAFVLVFFRSKTKRVLDGKTVATWFAIVRSVEEDFPEDTKCKQYKSRLLSFLEGSMERKGSTERFVVRGIDQQQSICKAVADIWGVERIPTVYPSGSQGKFRSFVHTFVGPQQNVYSG